MRRDRRPVFLNLLQIKLPVPGLVSIAHRVSGVLLFLALPVILLMLTRAIRDESGYQSVHQLLSSPLGILIVAPLVWSFWHHLLSGIRFLLLELDIGYEQQAAVRSAKFTLVLGLVLTLISVIWWYS